jgi:hypothetical protein
MQHQRRGQTSYSAANDDGFHELLLSQILFTPRPAAMHGAIPARSMQLDNSIEIHFRADLYPPNADRILMPHESGHSRKKGLGSRFRVDKGDSDGDVC